MCCAMNRARRSRLSRGIDALFRKMSIPYGSWTGCTMVSPPLGPFTRSPASARAGPREDRRDDTPAPGQSPYLNRGRSVVAEEVAFGAERAAAALVDPGAQAGLVALFAGLEVRALAEGFGQIGLQRDGRREIALGVHAGVVGVRVAVAFAVAEVLHQLR